MTEEFKKINAEILHESGLKTVPGKGKFRAVRKKMMKDLN